MLLRHVSLYLDLDDFAKGLGSEFLFRSCYLSHFITRRVRALRWHSDMFRGVFVQGRRDGTPPPRISVDKDLIVPVTFDQRRYRASSADELHEFFIAMLVDGLERAGVKYSLPLPSLLDAIEDFRRGGYRNEWTHQTRLLRPTQLRASLLCSLNQERFELRLKLERRGATVFDRKILETMPDELIFSHRFRDVVLAAERILVTDEFGKTTYSVRLDSLAPEAKS